MSTPRKASPLRDPEFLLWLGRFPGEWTTPRETLQVDRRPDGWLEARSPESGQRVALADVLDTGTWQRAPPSPLGFYPVVLSHSLMSLWLSREDQVRYRFAYAVREGQRHLLAAIEQSIANFPPEERDRRWLLWWNAENPQRFGPGDRTAHERLLRRFRGQ